MGERDAQVGDESAGGCGRCWANEDAEVSVGKPEDLEMTMPSGRTVSRTFDADLRTYKYFSKNEEQKQEKISLDWMLGMLMCYTFIYLSKYLKCRK